ncbi:MAG: hypothetical protein R2711_09930 [Acidimicrobiales bacterium]
MLEMIREMTDVPGRTVVMCTHLLLEAEGLADKVIVMEDGTDLVAGTPTELTQRFWPGTVVLVGAEAPIDLARSSSASPASTGRGRHRPRQSASTSTATTGRPTSLALVANLACASPGWSRSSPASRTCTSRSARRATFARCGGRQLSPVERADDGLPPAAVTDRHRQVAALTGWPGSEEAR